MLFKLAMARKTWNLKFKSIQAETAFRISKIQGRKIDAGRYFFQSLIFSLVLVAKVAHGGPLESLMSRAVDLYQPVAQSVGQTFEIRVTDDAHESASAGFEGTLAYVEVPKRVLENPRLGADAFAIILCHEIGHLYGGSPRKSQSFEGTLPVAKDGFTFSTSEGQSDYFATAVCFRRLALDQPALVSLQSAPEVPAVVQAQCRSSWPTSAKSRRFCERAAVASFQFLRLSFAFPISFETPDLSVAPRLVRDSYPSRQCRLDTLFRGALCPDEMPLKLDFWNSNFNDCRTHTYAQRPACWYQ
ncbi:MAG: hypothetical protein ACK5Y2_09535 [Bdellovibrionales bacterium]